MKTYVALSALMMLATCMAANLGMPFKRAHTDNFVAFSAGLTHNINLVGNATVQFDKVWLNEGNGYDNNTGVFTCPHAGVYVFIFHGLSESAGYMWLDLYKNGDYQMTAYAHNSADYASASNSVTLQLAENDTVYVRGHGSNVLYGRADEVYGSFSGFIQIPLGQ